MILKSKHRWLIPVGISVVVLGLIGLNLYLAVRKISEGLKATPQDIVEAKNDAAPDIVPEPVLTLANEDLVTSQDSAFTRDRSLQAGGHYKPQDTTSEGLTKLIEVKLGTQADFTSAEVAGTRHDQASPFVLVFTVPTAAAKRPGDPMPVAKSEDVVCTRYVLTRDTVSCDGIDRELGRVTFRGKFSDAFAAKIAVAGDSSAFYDEGAITGTVTFTELTTISQDVSLTYWKEE